MPGEIRFPMKMGRCLMSTTNTRFITSWRTASRISLPSYALGGQLPTSHWHTTPCCRYICMAEHGARGRRRVAFAFLDDIKTRFVATYGNSAQVNSPHAILSSHSILWRDHRTVCVSHVHTRLQTAIAFAMNDDFGRTLQKQMEHFNSPQGDQLTEVNQKMEDVKNVMVQNIEVGGCCVPLPLPTSPVPDRPRCFRAPGRFRGARTRSCLPDTRRVPNRWCSSEGKSSSCW